MNELQKKIFNVINAIIEIDDFEEYYKDHTIRYGLMNYVAKYSLAKDKYLITKMCLEHLENKNFLNKKGLRRGLKSRKNGFTYEHPIPSNRICAEIINNRFNKKLVKKILDWSNHIVVMTTEENNSLRKIGLQNNMPEGWLFFKSDVFSRYQNNSLVENNPKLSINVYGQIYR